MSKKSDIAALKKAGYSLLNPPDPRSDYYAAYLTLRDDADGKVKKRKGKRASKLCLDSETIQVIMEDRKARRIERKRRYRANMIERYSKKSGLHSLESKAKITGKTVAQLIVESWSDKEPSF
jgi:hypothetical protein